jgi:hypothetical protein
VPEVQQRFAYWSVILIAVLGAAIACGDSKSSTTTTTAAKTTVPANATTTQPADPATTEITNAFVTFFNGKDLDIDKKVNLLENGEKYRSMLVDASKDPQAQQLVAQVHAVKMLSAADCAAVPTTSPCATVTFDLVVGGFPALANHDSVAVKIGGVWKVGAKAWCDVVTIGGSSCPA